jgi:heptosyltransferase II
MKVGIFLPNWLGDLVMATPALRAIRRHLGPEVRIVGIIRPYLMDILSGTHWLDEFWPFDPRAARPEERRWAIVRRLRREQLDLCVLLTNSLPTAAMAWLGAARERVGYVRYARGPLLTHRLVPPRRHGRLVESPMVSYYLRLAEAIGCPPESPRMELATTEADEQSADRVWQSLGLRTDGRVVLMNCSGAYGPAKLWPAEHFGKLARRMATELDHDVLAICGPGEAPVAREIVGRAQSPRVFSLADQPLGLAATKVCLRRSRLLVSTDSGPRHIAAAFGTPVITLMGPTLPVWIDNPTVRGAFVRVNLDCLGCAKRVCPLGHHRCMKELSPDMVLEAVAQLLKQEEATCACCT